MERDCFSQQTLEGFARLGDMVVTIPLHRSACRREGTLNGGLTTEGRSLLYANNCPAIVSSCRVGSIAGLSHMLIRFRPLKLYEIGKV